MKLSSAPNILKHQARRLARAEGMPLHAALDRVATDQGFAGWSHLAARYAAQTPAQRLLATTRPGELMLLAARPGHGKTMLALQMAAEAALAGEHSAFFSLDYTESDVEQRLSRLGFDLAQLADGMLRDCSDGICADHIIARLRSSPARLVVVDYLQLLDQRRDTAPLAQQVTALKLWAEQAGHAVVFIAQIHRTYDAAVRPHPDWRDIRLPNPLDLSLFARACFLQDTSIKVLPAPSSA